MNFVSQPSRVPSFVLTCTPTPLDAPRALVSLLSSLPMMLVTQLHSSTAMTGRAVLLKFVRIDLPAVVLALAAVAALVDPWEAVVASAVLWEVVVDSQDVVDSAVALAVAVDLVALLTVVTPVVDLTRALLLFLLVPPTLSLTTLLPMARRVLLFMSAT